MSTFRITTNGMFRGYRSNLMKNNKKLHDTITDVQTQRKFNTYAEDPAAASQAWRLRRSFWRNSDQIDNSQYVISKYESAYAAMDAVIDGNTENPGLDGLLATIEGISDSAGSTRFALGRELLSTSDSIVSMLNTKYGDDFVFAGADGANIPYEWDGDRLLYRGIDVNLAQPKELSELGFDKDTLDKYNLTSPALSDYDAKSGKTDIEHAKLEKPLTMEEFKESAYYDAGAAGTDDEKYAAYKAEYLTRNQDDANGYVKLQETADAGTAFAEANELYGKLSSFQSYAAGYVAEKKAQALTPTVIGSIRSCRRWRRRRPIWIWASA
jgi:flagellin-like hook-associated protein FlgL